MASRLETLTIVLQSTLGDLLVGVTAALGEVTIVVKPENLITVAQKLRDAPELKFEQLIDVCSLDYRSYGDGAWSGQRFAVVYHLLSVSYNCRLRMRVFAADDDFPVIDSVIGI